MRYLIMATALAALAPSPALGKQVPAATQATVVRDAEAFMAAYAKDLATGNRAELAARYSRDGAHMLGLGPAERESQAQLAASYADARWQPPTRFAWRDLAYEPLGRDAVVVVGGFEWDAGNGKPAVQFAYTALLRSENGVLRIRVEHENPLRPPPAGAPAP